MNKYFFIPAFNEKYISNKDNLNSDYFVFDLEDSVKGDYFEKSVNNILNIKFKNNYFVRLKIFYNSKDDYINGLRKNKINNFILPKIENLDQLTYISEIINNDSCIVLFESPLGILNAEKIIESKILNISGIGFGSHDYCNHLGMKYNFNNLYYTRFKLLNIAKAFDIKVIDVVNINLFEKEEFVKEVKDGFYLGFDGKFLIHPNQIHYFDEIEFFSKEETETAKYLVKEYNLLENYEIGVIKYKDKIYEKPHIKNLIKIYNWSKSNAF